MGDDTFPVYKELPVRFCGAAFYAFYLVTLGQTLRWQLFTDEGWKIRRNRRNIILTATILIFIFTTTYISLGLYKAMQEVYKAVHGHTMPGYIDTLSTIGQCTTANLAALLADTVLMYRCWVVYGKSKRILIFPVLMWIGGIICTVIQAYWQAVQTGHFGTGHWEPVNMSIGPGIVLTPFWATTLALNTYTTGLLVYRILAAVKDSKAVGSPVQPLQLLLRVFAESGVLYFSTTIAHLVIWFTPSSFGIAMLSEINVPTIGIAFNIILIRAAENRAREAREEGSQRNGVSTMRYASNNALPSPKGVIIISSETESMTSNSELGSDFATRLPSDLRSPA
ncbi:hypothetical protein D9619_010704 [Psilocybe cf. subviscida]|uniref:Uncharacterized protein n=1 Tax=Psilocybe cf. subviscida TaxID=2480587 RepID=A0A8H5BAY5_9AGAR|nr:hypothetical protein D9619_010704 [Psilocybe cf. subviscida]